MENKQQTEVVTTPSRTITGLQKLLIMLVATVFALVLAEVLVRGMDVAPKIHRIKTGIDDRPYVGSRNTILGYEMMPNYRRDPSKAEPTRRNADFHCDRTNDQGLRDIDRSVDRIPNKKRIILLGDSVVAGHGIWMVDDTISRQMEALHANGDIEVLNFGMGGYNTRAEAELLRVKGIQYNPDLVAVIVVENDFENFNTQVEKYAYQRPRWSESLFIQSHLFRTLSIKLNLFNFKEQLAPKRYRVGENRKAMKDEFKTVVESGFHLIRNLQQKHGFDVLVFTWPRFETEKIVDEPLHQSVSSIAGDRGFDVISLAPSFKAEHSSRQDSASPRATYTLDDGMHPNRHGAAIAARAISAAIAKRDI